jgi:hypothetical protein
MLSLSSAYLSLPQPTSAYSRKVLSLPQPTSASSPAYTCLFTPAGSRSIALSATPSAALRCAAWHHPMRYLCNTVRCTLSDAPSIMPSSMAAIPSASTSTALLYHSLTIRCVVTTAGCAVGTATTSAVYIFEGYTVDSAECCSNCCTFQLTIGCSAHCASTAAVSATSPPVAPALALSAAPSAALSAARVLYHQAHRLCCC